MSGNGSTRHLSEIAVGTFTGLAIAACFIAPPRPVQMDGGGGMQDGNGPLDAQLDALDGPVDPGSDARMCTLDGFNSGLCPTGMLGSATGGTIGQSGGVLYLNVNSGSSAANVECFTQAQSISSMTIEVKAPYVSSSLGAHTFTGYMTDGSQEYGVRFVYSGVPSFIVTCPGGGTTTSPVPWDATNHKYVRVTRGAQTEVGLSATPTGTLEFAMSCPSPPSPVHAHLLANRMLSGSADGGGSAQFESLELCQ